MQRLRPPQHRRQRLDRRADDVVVRVLLGQADPRRLAMRAQQLRLLGLGAQARHDPRPQRPRRAQLGDLHEQIHADAEEERQPRRELVDRLPRRHRRANIGHPVGERVGQLLDRRRPGLVHMIARDRDAVELGHLGRRIADDVRHDPHRGFGRIDVGIPDRELFQNVVLDRPRKRSARDPLLLPRDNVERQDRQHRAVHRHADRHFVERNAVEQ